MEEENEVEFSDPEMFSGSSLACDYPCSSNTDMERFLEEMMRSTHNCTHTHTCNPATGPDNSHTHTCYHTHTQLLAPGNNGSGDGIADADADADTSEMQQPSAKKKRPVGNREAVKKYREKKKAHAAQLEEQVRQLKVLQAQLFKRLQGQAALEAEVVRLRPFETEVMRLRSLLSEFRGRIDGELGSYPFQPQSRQQQMAVRGMEKEAASAPCSRQPLAGGFYLNSFAVPCDAEVQCLHREDLQWQSKALREGQSKMKEQLSDQLWLTDCEVGSTDCQQRESRDGLSSPGCTTLGSEDILSSDCPFPASNMTSISVK